MHKNYKKSVQKKVYYLNILSNPWLEYHFFQFLYYIHLQVQVEITFTLFFFFRHSHYNQDLFGEISFGEISSTNCRSVKCRSTNGRVPSPIILLKKFPKKIPLIKFLNSSQVLTQPKCLSSSVFLFFPKQCWYHTFPCQPVKNLVYNAQRQ